MASELRIIVGAKETHLTNAPLILYDALATEFRIGFSGLADFVRLFQVGVNPSSGLTSLLESQIMGILTLQTA